MSNDTTTPVTNTEPKKRGRKPGTKSPREIYCFCLAHIDGELVTEEVKCASSDKDTSDDDVVAEAKQLFVDAHDVEPEQIMGPYFPRKGGGGRVSVAKRPNSLSNLSLETTNLVPSKIGTGLYRGWNVSVKPVENHPDAAYILYKNHATEDKKTKPASKFVLLSEIENLVIQDRV